jgi:hypothetical protein
VSIVLEDLNLQVIFYSAVICNLHLQITFSSTNMCGFMILQSFYLDKLSLNFWFFKSKCSRSKW